jgi:hypothetical protein
MMDYAAPPAYYQPVAHRSVKTEIVGGDAQVVRMMCHGKSEYGCADVSGTATLNNIPIRCLIVIRTDLGAAMYNYILRHETAHCNGWRHP